MNKRVSHAQSNHLDGLSIVTGTPLVVRVAAAVLATVLVALPPSPSTEESTLENTGTTGVLAPEARPQNKKSQHLTVTGSFPAERAGLSRSLVPAFFLFPSMNAF
jgi:hypothetical protein